MAKPLAPGDDLPLAERTVPGLFDRALAQAPDRPCLVSPRGVWSYRETDAIVDRLAGVLAAYGVGAASRVAVLHGTSERYPWLLLACARIGAVAVALNHEATHAALAYFVRHAAADLVVVEQSLRPAYDEAVAADGARRPRLLTLPESDDWLDAIGPSAPYERADPRFDEPFVTLFTSGSSGMPKAVEVSHGQAVTTALIFVEELGLGADDRLYTCLPFFHVNATCYTLCGALAAGASAAIGPRFSARGFWHDVAALGATQLNAMGTMLKILEQRDPGPEEREHAVDAVFVAPLPADAAELGERWGVRFATTYGQTEWLPTAMTRPGEAYDRPRVAGRIMPTTEVLIVDEIGQALAPGEVGEITLRPVLPGTTFRGYVGRPEESLATFRDLRFHTGDLGAVDEDGWLFYWGRKKDVIRRRGENIAATMVEELVAAHPAVVDAAAVPVPDEISGDEVFVFAATDDATTTVDELHAFCERTMPRYMRPRYLRIVDALPRTATNKVAKPELLQRALADVGAAPAEPAAPTPSPTAARSDER
jgi:crotonobetaine/carnitine-CoA ligase